MDNKQFAQAVSDAEAQLQEALQYKQAAVTLYVQQLLSILEDYKEKHRAS